MRETWVRSLGREDPLEKEMAMHCSILAWRIPWTDSMDMNLGKPQEIGKDWEVWHAALHGVAKIQEKLSN